MKYTTSPIDPFDDLDEEDDDIVFGPLDDEDDDDWVSGFEDDDEDYDECSNSKHEDYEAMLYLGEIR